MMQPQIPLSREQLRRRQGAVLVLMLLLLPVALIMAAFAVNIAYIELSRTELSVATDAATRAGGRELIMTADQKAARSRAKELALLNSVAAIPLRLSNTDIVFGQSIRPAGSNRYNFTATTTNPNAMKVAAHRDGANSNGPVALLMPSVLGKNSVNVTQTAISTQIEVDIGLVVDRSGSMAYAADEVCNSSVPPASAPPGWVFGDPAPPNSRWLDLTAAVRVFLNELTTSHGNELLALSSYSNSALTDMSLTSTYSSINTAMNVYTNSFPTGATNIGSGIIEGGSALMTSPNQRPGAAKVLIVMTDGMHNTGTDPLLAAQAVAAKGIMIFAVTFSDEADQVRMQQVALIGNGKHFHANTAAQLTTAFQKIAQALPTSLTL